MKESDGHYLYNTPKAFADTFFVDWKRLHKSARFMQMIAAEAKIMKARAHSGRSGPTLTKQVEDKSATSTSGVDESNMTQKGSSGMLQLARMLKEEMN